MAKVNKSHRKYPGKSHRKSHRKYPGKSHRKSHGKSHGKSHRKFHGKSHRKSHGKSHRKSKLNKQKIAGMKRTYNNNNNTSTHDPKKLKLDPLKFCTMDDVFKSDFHGDKQCVNWNSLKRLIEGTVTNPRFCPQNNKCDILDPKYINDLNIFFTKLYYEIIKIPENYFHLNIAIGCEEYESGVLRKNEITLIKNLTPNQHDSMKIINLFFNKGNVDETDTYNFFDISKQTSPNISNKNTTIIIDGYFPLDHLGNNLEILNNIVNISKLSNITKINLYNMMGGTCFPSFKYLVDKIEDKLNYIPFHTFGFWPNKGNKDEFIPVINDYSDIDYEINKSLFG